MLLTYGQGEYFEGQKRWTGRIVLSEHKLYLTGPQGDMAATYIPLEKIVKVKNTRSGIAILVRPSILERYQIVLKGDPNALSELVQELVTRRALKKRWLTREWEDRSL